MHRWHLEGILHECAGQLEGALWVHEVRAEDAGGMEDA